MKEIKTQSIQKPEESKSGQLTLSFGQKPGAF